MSASTGYEEERRELERVLQSEAFVRAPGLAGFLSYVSEKYFQGEADQIKEYNIAIEAFGRPPDFNQKQDSVVRVEAHRLRKRLREYYETDGAAHPVHILLPPGQYVPQFIRPKAAQNGNPVPIPAEEPAVSADSPQVPAVTLPATIPGPLPPLAVSAQRSWTRMGFFGIAATTLVLGGFSLARWKSAPLPVVSKNAAVVPGAEPGGDEVRILAGSPETRYVDRLGNIWQGDRFFKGGSVAASPHHRIWCTTDPGIFQVRREGNDFSYDIPLKPGSYELHLYFAETVFGEENVAGGGETSRIFRVFANGTPLLNELDVFSDAGGANLADEKVFAGITPAADGALHLEFRMIKESAILNGIAILPAPAGKPRPVRILARDLRYTDQQRQVWLPDRYFTHGQTVLRPEAIEGTPDPETYRGERFGHFRYTIPVAPGRYAVHLRFNEAWFGPTRPGGGGAGSRVFDVFANGIALLRNFDIYQAAGGSNRAIKKTFHGLAPNAQGKIVLSFVPVRNYACVNAIEVVDESN